MFLPGYLTVLCAATAAVFSSPVLAAPRSRFPRSTANTTSVPVRGVDGPVQPRLEIRTLASDADQWNIFLLGLLRFMQMDPSDPQSYYQIAGIHGATWGAWDNDGPCDGCGGSGYCTHSSTLFPTWHRPYLALFEQSLQANALAAANEFNGTDKARYVAAATTLRLPYWDWAMTLPSTGSCFPVFMTTSQIQVTKPHGLQNITNPLVGYQFPKNATLCPAPYNTGISKRYPDSQGNSQQNQVISQMAIQHDGLRSNLWMLFSQQKQYDYMSTEMWMYDAGAASYNSLEAIHDVVHVTVGGNGGNMADVPVAAFDPSFWFHHCMIDRSFAIWQALNPQSSFDTVTELSGTFALEPNTLVDSNTALIPFHSDTNGSPWTSKSVWDLRTFNYTYPELPANGTSIASINTQLNKLYYVPPAQLSSNSSNSTTTKRDLGNYPRQVTDANVVTQEYLVNLKADTMSVGCSLQAFVFDGTFDDSKPSGWSTEPNLIGYHAWFGNSLATSTMKSTPVTATIPLTAALENDVSSGSLSSMSVSDVQTYLQNHIQWRFMTIDGVVMAADEIPGLVVSVATSKVTPASSTSGLPVWGDFSILQLSTQNKTGGLNSTSDA